MATYSVVESSIRSNLLVDYTYRKIKTEAFPSFVISEYGKVELLPFKKNRYSTHVLYAPNGMLTLLPSLFIHHQSVVEMHTDTKTAAQALLAFYRFLHDKGLSFNDLSRDPRDGALWAFRDYLVDNIKVSDEHGIVHGYFDPSTIKVYIGQVISYYKWLIDENYLLISNEARPFTYKWVKRKEQNKDDNMLSHMVRNRKLEPCPI